MAGEMGLVILLLLMLQCDLVLQVLKSSLSIFESELLILTVSFRRLSLVWYGKYATCSHCPPSTEFVVTAGENVHQLDYNPASVISIVDVFFLLLLFFLAKHF